MARIVVPLGDKRVQALKPLEKNYKVGDGGGLFICVDTRGGKKWRFDYAFEGKRQSLSFGAYPAVSLRAARDRRDEARGMLERGVNPSEKGREAKLKGNTIESVTREYIELRGELSEDYKDKVFRLIELNVMPYLKTQDFATVKPLEMLKIIKKIEERGAKETAHRVFTLLDRIYRYGVMVGKCEHNIMADLDKSIALKKVGTNNFAHVTTEDELRMIMLAIESYRGSVYVQVALKITPYLFVRPFNIRSAEWGEFDFEAKVWNIPAHKMKIKRAHLVPLSDLVISIIKTLEPFRTNRFLFPSAANRDRSMSDNTINQALKRLDLKDVIVAHGFRHTASTLLHENMNIHGVHSEAIEAQLAHTVGGVKGVYNKAIYMPERVKLMLWWSDYLDRLLKR